MRASTMEFSEFPCQNGGQFTSILNTANRNILPGELLHKSDHLLELPLVRLAVLNGLQDLDEDGFQFGFQDDEGVAI